MIFTEQKGTRINLESCERVCVPLRWIMLNYIWRYQWYSTVTSKALRNSLPFNAENGGCFLYKVIKVNEFPQRQI